MPKILKILGGVAVGLATLAGVLVARPQTLSFYSSLAGERGIRITRDTAYGPLERQKLDIYRPPENVPEREAIIVFLYGGSWTSGDKALYAFVGQALAMRGFVTVIPDYRLYPQVQFPAFFNDAAMAYVWAERTLARGCSPARPVILAGHSAGGHMAAMLALNPRYIAQVDAAAAQPSAFVGLAGPYTFVPTTWPSTKAAFASTVTQPDAARPITFVHPGAPPALLVHGLADDLVNPSNTRDLAAALKSVGTSVETEEYPGIGHIGLVLAISKPFRWRAPVLDRIAQFANTFGAEINPPASCQQRSAKTQRETTETAPPTQAGPSRPQTSQ